MHCSISLDHIALQYFTGPYRTAVFHWTISHCSISLDHIVLQYFTAVVHWTISHCSISLDHIALQYFTGQYRTAVFQSLQYFTGQYSTALFYCTIPHGSISLDLQYLQQHSTHNQLHGSNFDSWLLEPFVFPENPTT